MEIVIDTETAGFYSGWDELLQVSVIDGEGYVLFDRLIKPSRRKKWPDAQRVHGISPMTVRSWGTFREYRNELQEIFDAADVIIGYNTEFDLGFLAEQGILIPDCRHADVMLDFAPVYGEWSEYYGNYKYQKLDNVRCLLRLSVAGQCPQRVRGLPGDAVLLSGDAARNRSESGFDTYRTNEITIVKKKKYTRFPNPTIGPGVLFLSVWGYIRTFLILSICR